MSIRQDVLVTRHPDQTSPLRETLRACGYAVVGLGFAVLLIGLGVSRAIDRAVVLPAGGAR